MPANENRIETFNQADKCQPDHHEEFGPMSTHDTNESPDAGAIGTPMQDEQRPEQRTEPAAAAHAVRPDFPAFLFEREPGSSPAPRPSPACAPAPHPTVPGIFLPAPPQPPSYEVGYKKPPKAHRFKKGESGNKRGRPKRPKTVAEALENVLHAPVVVRENGKKRRVTRVEAMFLAAVSRVTTSPDLKGFSSVMSALKATGSLNEKPEPQGRTGVLLVPANSANFEEWARDHGLAAKGQAPCQQPPPEHAPDAPKPPKPKPK